jgi:hypothetical protein
MEQQFFHVRMIVGFVVGLSITNLLKGVAKFIVHPKHEKPYWLHLLWVFYFFILLVHFWWWEFGLSHVPRWTFPEYFYIIVFATFFFINSSLLFPESLSDYDGYKDYYFTRMNWFFGLLAMTFVLDVTDTLLKGSSHLQYLGGEYFFSVVLHAICFMALAKIKNEKFHAVAVIAFILYQFSWIYRAYRWMGDQWAVVIIGGS